MEKFPVFICKNCGFLFTQDHPDESQIGFYYQSEDYISHSNTSKGITNRLYQIARKFMLKRKAVIIRKITSLKSGNLLDIGCGTGHFAGYLKETGWKVQGIEINAQARDFAKNTFGFDVKDPSEIEELPDRSYDCITLWHVLEHFNDPFAYMLHIRRLLKPEGTCLIALPNCSSYDAMHYAEDWAAWDVPRHLWHFSPETFKNFIDHTGFILEEVKNLPLDVFYISLMSEKYKGSALSLIKGLIKGLWFSVQTLVNLKRSSSLIYILKQR